MKRLKSIMRSMEERTATYSELYNAPIRIASGFGTPYGDNDATFFHEDRTYTVFSAHKLAQDCPIWEIGIPIHQLCPDDTSSLLGKENQHLKRLKYYFRLMQNDTVTYSFIDPDAARMNGANKHDIYDGFRQVTFPEPEVDPDRVQPPTTDNDPTYYADRHSFTLERAHKLAQDCPIVEIGIPTDEILPGLADSISQDTALCDTLRIAAADFCLRAFAPFLDTMNAALYNRSRPDKENGAYYLDRPRGEILVRNGAYFAEKPQRDYDYLSGMLVKIKDDGVERPPLLSLCFRIQVQLPAKKLKRAMTMLTSDLPEAVDLFVGSLDRVALLDALELACLQLSIRRAMKEAGLVAFLADGSILPRAKDGVSPMADAIPFVSTPEDAVTLCGVRGMGIRSGVTLITGGGYSGKSTLLDAIAAGIYDHPRGDGRELVLTDPTAVSIAAEDGRAVASLNISPFIKQLPSGETTAFSTAHASGSTSQASNIMEAIADGASLLLIDEDRSATNFMIRDSKMKALIQKEPITPFTDRVRELASCGISTILVIGGSGEYLGVADRVYLMDDYIICDVSAQANTIWQQSDSTLSIPAPANWSQTRRLLKDGFSSYPTDSHTERLEVSDLGYILIGDERVDIRGLMNITADTQLNALGFILRTLMVSHRPEEKLDLDAELDALYDRIHREGLHCIFSAFFTTTGLFLALPRKCEVKAAIHRMRHKAYTRDPQ